MKNSFWAVRGFFNGYDSFASVHVDSLVYAAIQTNPSLQSVEVQLYHSRTPGDHVECKRRVEPKPDPLTPTPNHVGQDMNELRDIAWFRKWRTRFS